MAEESARAIARAWFWEQAKDRDSVSVPAMTDEAVDYFSEQKGFVRSVLKEFFRNTLYEEGLDVLRRRRDWRGVVLLGDELVKPEEFARRAQAVKTRWEQWYEKAGEAHICILKMTRSHLLLAAAAHRATAEDHARKADFYEALAERVGRRGVVETRLTAEELERLRVQFMVGVPVDEQEQEEAA